MPCHNCGRGFHDECLSECEVCHSIDDMAQSVEKSLRGAPIKEPQYVTDGESTGRKRAAYIYPLFRGKACEWQGKKNCGGGSEPIIGCIEGRQQHRHHGPVKNTLRNEQGNVHRICSKCHSRWHAKNDGIYNEEVYDELPHSPEPASKEELVLNDAYYKIKNRGSQKGNDDS